MDFFELRVGQVGVDLSGGDVAVSEHRLDTAQISAVNEQIGGKGVAQSVWCDVFGDTSQLAITLNSALNGASGQAGVIAMVDFGLRAAVVDEKRFVIVLAFFQVILDRYNCFLADIDRPVFLPLTTNRELAAGEINLIAVEAGQLRDAQSAREKQLHDGAVTQADGGRSINGVKKPLNLITA